MWQWLTRLKEGKQPTTTRAATVSSGLRQESLNPHVQALSRKLENHLFCWVLDSDYARLSQPPRHLGVMIKEMQRRVRVRDGSAMTEMPRQPAILPLLMRAVTDPDTPRQEITRIVLSDPALTHQLLLIANSPFFRPSDQAIESVDHAIFLLGMDGIRNVISAALLRPMMSARNSQEAQFIKRVWRWGLTTARASELVARADGQDATAFFMIGLLPSLSYLTLYRETLNVLSERWPGEKVEPAMYREMIGHHYWQVCQLIAHSWKMPPRYHAYLLEAERPSPVSEHSPLNDGLILATREVLLAARQRNLPEEDLRQLLRLSGPPLEHVRQQLDVMVKGEDAPGH